MVVSIFANTQIQKTSYEKKQEKLVYSGRFAEKFGKQLNALRTPSKAMSTLLSWTEFMPLPYRWLSLFADQRYAVKAVTSTFALPMFFVKQIKLYESCQHLKNRLFMSNPLNMGKVIGDVKKIFFSFLAAILGGIKLTQLLDKTRIVNLNKISQLLPNILAKSNCLLSLALHSMKMIDISWALQSQLKKENLPVKEYSCSPSRKMTKTMMKLGANSAKVLSNSISVAALFLGWTINPLVSAAISTLSVVASITCKIACRNHFFGKRESKAFKAKAFAALPA